MPSTNIQTKGESEELLLNSKVVQEWKGRNTDCVCVWPYCQRTIRIQVMTKLSTRRFIG
jgi:hypothetical protein